MVKKIIDRREKKQAMKLCRGIMGEIDLEYDFDKLFEKIDKYADFFIDYQNEISGYAAMYNNDHNTLTAYITMICVRPQFQRKHIGSLLIYECIKSAQLNGMKYIRLEVLNTNKKAILFYKSLDFEYERKCSDNSFYMKRML